MCTVDPIKRCLSTKTLLMADFSSFSSILWSKWAITVHNHVGINQRAWCIKTTKCVYMYFLRTLKTPFSSGTSFFTSKRPRFIRFTFRWLPNATDCVLRSSQFRIRKHSRRLRRWRGNVRTTGGTCWQPRLDCSSTVDGRKWRHCGSRDDIHGCWSVYCDGA